jgi:hypothetical protein
MSVNRAIDLTYALRDAEGNIDAWNYLREESGMTPISAEMFQRYHSLIQGVPASFRPSSLHNWYERELSKAQEARAKQKQQEPPPEQKSAPTVPTSSVPVTTGPATTGPVNTGPGTFASDLLPRKIKAKTKTFRCEQDGDYTNYQLEVLEKLVEVQADIKSDPETAGTSIYLTLIHWLISNIWFP